MEQIIQQIGDVLIQVDFVGENCGVNVYEITLENKKGKSITYYFHESTYNTHHKIPLTMDRVITSIMNDFEINSKTYTNYYDFAYDFDYERFDKKSQEYKDGKEIYKEKVKFGNDLKKVISQEWIDSMETYFKLKG
jgi:hypothetical protein